MLDAARAIKKKVPDAVPLNVYTGKPNGEAATMQGFEMLLYGTGDGGSDPLYDTSSSKWIAGSKAFKDSLRFVETVFRRSSGPTSPSALDPNWATRVRGEFPAQAQAGHQPSTVPGCRRTG